MTKRTKTTAMLILAFLIMVAGLPKVSSAANTWSGSGDALAEKLGVMDPVVGAPSIPAGANASISLNFPSGSNDGEPIPPIPPSPLPAIHGFIFSQTFAGPYQVTSVFPYTVGVFSSTGPGTGTRTGVYPGTFTASYRWNVQWADPSHLWPGGISYSGIFMATMTGVVNGVLGETLTGTMMLVFTDPVAGQLTLGGPVTIMPNGDLTCTFSGNGVAYPTIESLNVTDGMICQPEGPLPPLPKKGTPPGVRLLLLLGP
jgi:hypothetical protein